MDSYSSFEVYIISLTLYPCDSACMRWSKWILDVWSFKSGFYILFFIYEHNAQWKHLIMLVSVRIVVYLYNQVHCIISFCY